MSELDRRLLDGQRLGIFPLHLDPPTTEQLKIIEGLLQADNDIDHIRLIPNTRFAVSIGHSLHLAAMAHLATKHLPNVSIDYTALESPDCHLPIVEKLLSQFPKSSVIHWLPDLHEATVWKGISSWAPNTKFILLKPKQFKPETGMLVSEETRSMFPKRQIVEVERSPGADARRKLFEGESDPKDIVPASVLKYIDSHGLYRDFRKSKKYFWGVNTSSNPNAAAWHPTVSIQGSIPRLMLLYDESNLIAQEIYRKLKPFSVREGEEPDLIVPIGGDGYMMHSIRTHWRKFIPFFGVNAGHVGYLLNDAATLEELFSAPLLLYQASMLYTEAETYEVEQDPVTKKMVNKKLFHHAFNDAWLERSTGQTALINVKINGVERLKRVRGDGVLVSTALGSTAYSLALGASPIPVGSPLLQLVGSNIVSPARWKPVHLNNDVVVELETIDPIKRPCRGFVDSVVVGDVKSMAVKASRVAGVQIAFVESCDVQAKLYQMQFPTG